MKKTLSTILTLGLFCFCSTLAFAADNVCDGSKQEGQIVLTDIGSGPGITIDISQNSCASYNSATSAGGFGNGTYTGENMCVVTGSAKAEPKTAVYFAVRASTNPDNQEDNNVYQVAASGIAVAATQCTTYAATDISTWHVRGQS